MTRIALGGAGRPIITIAFPTNETDESGAFWVTLDNGAEFRRQQWLDQGYTNYDVFCIGGAGGQGGAAVETNRPLLSTLIWRIMPDDVWQAYLRLMQASDNQTSGETNHRYQWGDSPPTGETWTEHEVRTNPTHRVWFSSYAVLAYLNERNASPQGGGGGGGGLAKQSGVLEELPEVVLITVGQAGAKGTPGQDQIDGFFVPGIEPYDREDDFLANPANAGTDLALYYNWRKQFRDEDWPEEFHNGFYPPAPGSDGGVSSFGDFCRASGGKGGQAGKIWNNGVSVLGGRGGAGGMGGQATAGGGAAGSTALPNMGADGVWDGVNGSGGGGGHAGESEVIPNPQGSPITRYINASDGGIGSYSFDDPSLYGERGHASYFRGITRTFDQTTGEMLSEVLEPPDMGKLIIPGQGGGASPRPGSSFGSPGGGGSVNGAVLVRLSTAIY